MKIWILIVLVLGILADDSIDSEEIIGHAQPVIIHEAPDDCKDLTQRIGKYMYEALILRAKCSAITHTFLMIENDLKMVEVDPRMFKLFAELIGDRILILSSYKEVLMSMRRILEMYRVPCRKMPERCRTIEQVFNRIDVIGKWIAKNESRYIDPYQVCVLNNYDEDCMFAIRSAIILMEN